MKHFSLLVLLFSILGFGQNPIQWKKNVKDLGNNTYEVQVIADLQPGWHLYSTENTNEFIIPTTVKFQDQKAISWLSPVQAKGEKKSIYSEAFEDNLIEYIGDVVYSRKFKTTSTTPLKIVAEIEYQICDETKCLAPENIELDIAVTPKNTSSVDAKANEDKKEEENSEETKDEDLAVATSTLPSDSLNTASIQDTLAQISTQNSGNRSLIIPSLNVDKPLYTNCGESSKKNDKSYMLLFGLGFLGGLLAMLTPCVYPMIPLTISFFTKGSGEHKGRANAFIYAAFIFIIFVLISMPFHIFNVNSDIFNQISTNVYVNIFFFVVFVFFAFSFFGYYELTLPQSWLNKTDKLSNSGGIVGLFFMALTLVIVSFSCTGPILGGLLGSISGADGANKLTSAFGGFGLSWALIFGLLALFPQMIKSLPKSGGWLNTTKVILGFIELALSLKFLSKADLVSKTFMLKREIFVLFWIVIAILTILYLLGFIRFPHDERPNKMTREKRILAIIFLAFGIYLLPGLFPNHNKPNLKLLSGITPPMTVSYFHEEQDCPLGLNCVHDYFEAVQLAKAEKKPILIDFTGWGCENCRKMEEFVWSDPEVLKILNNDVVLASLYVDDKEALKEPYSIELKDGSRRKIKTIGNEWSIFQKENFKEQTQPQYVLVTPDEQVINYPVGGYMSKEEFLKFLKCGIDSYKANN